MCIDVKYGAFSESSASRLLHLLLSELPALVLKSLVSLGKFMSWTPCFQEAVWLTFHFRMMSSLAYYFQYRRGAVNDVWLFRREKDPLRTVPEASVARQHTASRMSHQKQWNGLKTPFMCIRGPLRTCPVKIISSTTGNKHLIEGLGWGWLCVAHQWTECERTRRCPHFSCVI